MSTRNTTTTTTATVSGHVNGVAQVKGQVQHPPTTAPYFPYGKLALYCGPFCVHSVCFHLLYMRLKRD